MRQMALEAKTVDIGKVLSDAATIRGQNLQNRLLEGKMAGESEAKDLSLRAVGADPVYNSLAAGGGGPTQQAAGLLESGTAPASPDSNAMQKLLALDPKRAQLITNTVGKMDENQRKELEHKNKITGQMMFAVLSAPPDQQPMLYAQMKAKAQQMGLPIEGAPEQWDPRWGKYTLTSVTALDDTLKMQKQKPPTTKEFKEGDQFVTKQWNADSGKWEELSKGRRFKPQEGAEYKALTKPAKLVQDRKHLTEGLKFPEDHPAVVAIDREMAKAGAPSDVQGKAAGFADRMTQAEAVLNKVDREGAKFLQRLTESAPGGNYLRTKEYQMYDQAKRNFVNAQLRRESGAVINPEEFDNADKQYFPQPGDGDAVIKQKRQNRTAALKAMVRDAGAGYKGSDRWVDIGGGIRIREKK